VLALARGSRLGPYEILSPLGAGGMGEVYRASDTRLGREVAIKVMPPEFAADPERLKRFEREARATAALDHPNLLAVYDVGTHEGTPYIVEQLLEGESLRARLALGAPPLREALGIGAQIARGLAAAHSRNVIHRDLKPENVFLTKDGIVKILDFGLAKLVDPALYAEAETVTSPPPNTTVAGHILGTAAYMAPEQACGLPVDHRADIFAFGVILYELLSGRGPFRGTTHSEVIAAVLKDDPEPLPGPLPPGLESLVYRCLEKRPENQFSSARDLALALEGLSPSSAARRSAESVPTSQQRTEHERVRILHLPKRRTVVVGVGLSVAVLAALGFWSVRRWRQVAWARNEALPELVRLTDARAYWKAFLLAKKIEAVVPEDQMLRKLRPRFAGEFRHAFRPSGAEVLARSPEGGEEDWVRLGEAKGAPLPAPLGYSVFRVRHPGFEPHEFAVTVSEFGWDSYNLKGTVALRRKGEHPDGMIRIETPSEKMWSGLQSLDFEFTEEQNIASFFVDKHEVTNREYKRFVDAGGYQRRDHWKEPFERDDKVLAWDEAMSLFRDATGRPGPASWEAGSYQKGKDDYPVTGVSWYEAAAYAAFAGKRLPSVYQWTVAGAPIVGGDFVPGSNFSGSLAPVGSYRGSLNYWGLYDVAGNAREWCTNASGKERFALGGACDGPTYLFWNAETKPPFDRNLTTGFRCIKAAAADPNGAQLDLPIARKPPLDLERERPFSEEQWSTWKDLLSYAKQPLEARVEWADDSLPSWRMEKVSFTAAYANERVVAYLFLPRNVRPPWQVVVFWPGGYAPQVGSSQDGRNTLDSSYWDYLVLDGRAVLYPILKGTFERGGRLDLVPDTSMSHGFILQAKDIFRSLDYLETRSDIQKDGIGFMGLSWGAAAGPFVCAVERRFKVELLLGGLVFDRGMMGFVRRCTTPTQLVSGLHDGYAANEAPIFRSLATPTNHKRHVVFDSDHALQGFRKEIVKVNLEWLDRYLGPVRGTNK